MFSQTGVNQGRSIYKSISEVFLNPLACHVYIAVVRLYSGKEWMDSDLKIEA